MDKAVLQNVLKNIKRADDKMTTLLLNATMINSFKDTLIGESLENINSRKSPTLEENTL